jgi:hypothetical protein
MPIRNRKTEPLDDTARRFLQIGQNTPEVHEGQSADKGKLQEGWERTLLHEACEYGDDMVRYVAMHKDLTPEEAAWGVCLGIYCARDVYPNGAEEFDDLGDQAAKDLVLPQTTVVTDEGEIARIQMELTDFDDAGFRRAALFSEKFQDFLKGKKQQLGISNRQGAYGLGRAFHNLRRTFPTDNGGSATFDELARRSGLYFVENKE